MHSIPNDDTLLDLAREECQDFRWPSTALSIMRKAIATAGAASDAPPELTDKQIQDAVFGVLRKWKDDRAWDRYTRETGAYDVTEVRAEVVEIIRAVLAVRGA